MGSAYLLGYHLAWNFRMPYLAENISEFWRRWHISLSSWLTDYVYIPLGGSRHGAWRTSCNLMITMVLCGLWHAASWTCILFGAVHGMLLVSHRGFHAWSAGRPWLITVLQTRIGLALRIGVTFFVFTLTLTVFRAQSLTGVQTFWMRLLSPTAAGLAEPLPAATCAGLAALVLIGHWLGQTHSWQRLVSRLPAGAVGFAYGVGLSLILLLAPPTNAPFIYFQF